MATFDFTATNTPRGLKAVLNLTPELPYTMENLSNSERVRVREAATAPARGERGHILKPGGVRTAILRTDEDLWCWTLRDEAEAACVLTPER